jgi:acyl-ACP thioesterase
MSQSIWREARKIGSFEVDTRGRLRPYMLFSFLIDSAWKHAASTGFGYQDLEQRNLMWVLSEFQVSILQTPLWGEEIEVMTWGKRIERFYALRDFAVNSQRGEKLASATGAWMILDKKSYRPQRLEQLMSIFPWEPAKSELQTIVKRLPELASGRELRRYQVVYSDLDANDHVNAAKYLQWVMDSYPVEKQKSRHVREIHMSFLAEATTGEEVSIISEPSDDKELSSVRRLTEMKDVCRLSMSWIG